MWSKWMQRYLKVVYYKQGEADLSKVSMFYPNCKMMVSVCVHGHLE